MDRIDAYTATASGNQFQDDGTEVSDGWLNGMQEETVGLIEASGQTPSAANNAQKLEAVKRFAGAHVKTVTFSDSPYTLTLADAGLVKFDTSGGVINVNYLAADSLAAVGFKFRHIAGAANVTFTPDGTDTTEVSLLTPYSEREVFSNGVDTWLELRALPVGSAIWYPGANTPAGFIRANGALHNRIDLPLLWDWVANQSGNLVADTGWAGGNEGAWSDGDGSTTFRCPDTRGVFLRALDDGRGIDASRAIGTEQADENKSHSHLLTVERGPAASPYAGISGAQTPIDDTYQTGTAADGSTEARPINVAWPIIIRH